MSEDKEHMLLTTSKTTLFTLVVSVNQQVQCEWLVTGTCTVQLIRVINGFVTDVVK